MMKNCLQLRTHDSASISTTFIYRARTDFSHAILAEVLSRRLYDAVEMVTKARFN